MIYLSIEENGILSRQINISEDIIERVSIHEIINAKANKTENVMYNAWSEICEKYAYVNRINSIHYPNARSGSVEDY